MKLETAFALFFTIWSSMGCESQSTAESDYNLTPSGLKHLNVQHGEGQKVMEGGEGMVKEKMGYTDGTELYSTDSTLIYTAELVKIIRPQYNENQDIGEEMKKSGFEMIQVQGGTFTMGGSNLVDDGGPAELRIADECPHPVRVHDFSIGKYEVTQADWLEIMGTNPSKQKNCAECPVEQVSWNDIQKFIAKANEKYDTHFRLPTEEEWEFAAKGGNNSGNYIYSGGDNAKEVAWFSDNSEDKPHPVGLLKANAIGIYDMSGNIWEWCHNEKTPYPCDTIGKIFDSKVLRGGSFSHRQHNVRVNDRNARNASMKLPTLGFRLAK